MVNLWLIEGIPTGELTGPAAVTLFGVLVITRRLRWHKEVDRELAKVEKERDEWKEMALSLLGVTEKLTVQAEVTNEVISRADTPPAGK